MTVRTSGPQPGEPQVGLSLQLLADLADWKLNLYARSFTRVSVDMLLRDLRRAVSSALGYTLVIVSAAGLPEVSITVADGRLPQGQIRSTVTFDLPVAHDITAVVTFYARQDDAFDELAALLGTSDTFATGAIRLGGPSDAEVEPGVHGLADHTKVNYALGVLLARGESIDEAHRHLQRLADRFGTIEAGAEHLLSAFGA